MVDAAETTRTPASNREVLGYRGFMAYMVTAVISNAGSFMQMLSVPFVLLELTDSYTWVGIGAFAWMFPSLLVAPAAGIVADRADRRRVLMWSSIVQIATSTGLWALAVADAMTPLRVVTLVAMGGLGAGFQYAAAQSMAAVLLPPRLLLHGVRLNSAGFTFSRAVGPAVAGVVLGQWGAATAFAINALSFTGLIAVLLVLRTRAAHTVVDGAGAGSWWERFVAGFRYVFGRPALRLVVITAFVGSFFGQSMVQLAAGLAKDDYGVGGAGLGALVAVYGAGSTVASVVLVIGGERLRRSRMALVGLSLFGCGLALAIATPWFALGLAGFLVAGTAHAFTNVSLNTSIQAQVHESYRGRALSMFLMALLAGMPLGTLAGGALGDILGLRPALALFATTIAVYVVFVVTRRDRLGAIDGEGPAD